MSGIVDGQPVNAAASNAAWLAKNGDDTASGKITLSDTDTATSGSSITNAQRELTAHASAMGIPINQAKTYTPTWLYSWFGTTTDSIVTRISNLVGKFLGTGGHAHSGVDGDGSKVAATNLTGQLPIASGGTGASTQQAAIDALSGTQSAGKVLRSDGTHVTLSNIQAGDVPVLNQNTTGTASNITGTAAIANGGTGQTTKAAAFDALSPNTSKGDIAIRSSTTNTRLPVGTDGYALVADSTQALGMKWAQASGGSGVGAKNYLTNYNFENNVTTSWSLSHTTLDSSKFPNQTSGSWTAAAGTLALSAVSSGQLAGSYSASLASSAASTAGDMLISDAFTIDLEDQAKVLAYKFYYKLSSGTGVFAGNNTNSYAVWIYDVTNSAWIQPAGVYNLVQSSGVGIAQGTFQTPSNGSQFRIAIVNINATAGAITMLFDDLYVGPQSLAFGPAMTDVGANPWTPTGTWTTNATYAGVWQRVGDMLKAQVLVSLSGAPTGSFTLNLPSGLSIDTNKLTTVTRLDVLGNVVVRDDSAATVLTGAVRYNSTTSLIALSVPSATGSALSPVTATAPFTFASLDTVELEFEVPIVGWSTNTAMSADTDTRKCTARAVRTSTQSIATATLTKVQFNSVTFDTHGTFDSTTNFRYVAPIADYYKIYAEVRWNASMTAASDVILQYKINGAGATTLDRQVGTANMAMKGFDKVQLNAGDYIEIFVQQNSGGALSTEASTTFVVIEKDTGPAVVAATESVNARYTTAAGASISTSGTQLSYGTKDYDTHGAWQTNQFVAPTVGKYRFNVMYHFTSTALTAGQLSFVDLKKGGAHDRYFAATQAAGGTYSHRNAGSTEINLLAGDTVTLFLTAPAASMNLSTSADLNYVEITRVGN
jgi:hypothetical protein